MSLFFKKEKSTGERKSIFEGNYSIDKSNWFQVFSACLGKMTVIQTNCGEKVVKGRNWNMNFSKGVISFGDDEYPLQFIGSESESSHSWLWGWENINGFDESLLSVANATKRLGEIWRLEPLTTAKFQLNDVFNGHRMSIVACGLANENLCYYRGPHSGGAVFAAFSGVASEIFAPIDDTRFIQLVMQCIQQFYVDHKIFIESLLLWNGTQYEWRKNSIIAHFKQDLKIEFEQADECLRIGSIKTI